MMFKTMEELEETFAKLEKYQKYIIERWTEDGDKNQGYQVVLMVDLSWNVYVGDNKPTLAETVASAEEKVNDSEVWNPLL